MAAPLADVHAGEGGPLLTELNRHRRRRRSRTGRAGREPCLPTIFGRRSWRRHARRPARSRPTVSAQVSASARSAASLPRSGPGSGSPATLGEPQARCAACSARWWLTAWPALTDASAATPLSGRKYSCWNARGRMHPVARARAAATATAHGPRRRRRGRGLGMEQLRGMFRIIIAVRRADRRRRRGEGRERASVTKSSAKRLPRRARGESRDGPDSRCGERRAPFRLPRSGAGGRGAR